MKWQRTTGTETPSYGGCCCIAKVTVTPSVGVYCYVKVHVPTVFSLMLVCRLTGPDIKSICAWNASVAAQYGRSDVLQAWSLAALVTDKAIVLSSDPYEDVPWPEHPFARQLIHSL